MSKKNRQQAIIDILSTTSVHTLSDLVQELRKRKHTVDVSTLSRDMALLKIAKTTDGYRILEDGSPSEVIAAQDGILRQLVTKVTVVNNLAVVHTISGSAMVVGRLIDLKQSENLVGSVCGDDTIICVAGSNHKAVKFQSWLSNIIKSV
jgi:transcriptional regulator of arginine metabolism